MKIKNILQTHADGIIYLPQWAWPGGYTIIYYDHYASIYCAKCAAQIWYNALVDNEKCDLEADTYDEGPDLYCEICDVKLESSYGESEENN